MKTKTQCYVCGRSARVAAQRDADKLSGLNRETVRLAMAIGVVAMALQ